ncbi:F-box family protein [Raphanus sativus]|uniref:F-box protein At3g28330-like n=1 Tax=Raphanus sativus TaxID=3726 RepID=A0A9W3BUN8_RAPSA|nr:F-box protein At3g28330-like [Raphanus sativus]KAJ4888923.1 F-box family protein [Raphanus sativus]
MNSLADDLWALIFVRLPLKSIATFKLVCKRWKSLLESPFLRNLFLSHHQNSHSMWSLMLKDNQQEAVAHYGCEIWGHPPQQLGSYIATFVTELAFFSHKEIYRHARAVAYTDVGLILIRVVSVLRNVSLYVANPVSRECVETDPPWVEPEEDYWNLGLATRTDENGGVLGYKVVLLYDAESRWTNSFNLLIYSSETGLWKQETVQFPYSFHYRHEFSYSISMNGHLHWVARDDVNDDEVVVSIDFYGSDHPVCRVTSFPDLGTSPLFQRFCTVSQGSLMYMNIASQGDEYHKLSVWRLKSSWEWNLVSEISYISYEHTYIPLAINPFDAETVYFWSNDLDDQCLVSMNLGIGEFFIHGKSERGSTDGCLLKTPEGKTFIQLAQEFSSFVLPKWLYRIPNTVTNNSRQPWFISNPTFIW